MHETQRGLWSTASVILHASFGFVRAHKHVLLIPLLGILVLILVVATFGMVLYAINPALLDEIGETSKSGASPTHVAVNFVWETIFVFLFAYVSAVLILVMKRTLYHKDQFSVFDSMNLPQAHVLSLFLWALISTVCSVATASLLDTKVPLPLLLSVVLTIAWSLLTMFVVQAMMIEKLSVKESLAHSARVFLASWKETLIVVLVGGIFLGVLALILGFLGYFIFTVGILLNAHAVLVPIGIVFVILAGYFVLFTITWQVVATTLLYVYGAEQSMSIEFDQALKEKVCVPKDVVAPM